MANIDKYISNNEIDYYLANDDLMALIVTHCNKRNVPVRYWNDFVNETYMLVLDSIKNGDMNKGSIYTIIYYATLRAELNIFQKYVSPVKVHHRTDKDLKIHIINSTKSLQDYIDSDNNITLLDSIGSHDKVFEQIENKETYIKLKEIAKNILSDIQFKVFFYYIENDVSKTEVGKYFNLSKQRVSNITITAARKLMINKATRDLIYDLIQDIRSKR